MSAVLADQAASARGDCRCGARKRSFVLHLKLKCIGSAAWPRSTQAFAAAELPTAFHCGLLSAVLLVAAQAPLCSSGTPVSWSWVLHVQASALPLCLLSDVSQCAEGSPAPAGPFIKLGPLRNVAGYAEKAGCLSAAGLVAILTACLAIYGAATFQQDTPQLGVKTLSGEALQGLACHSSPPVCACRCLSATKDD